jgi:hypothetical protein
MKNSYQEKFGYPVERTADNFGKALLLDKDLPVLLSLRIRRKLLPFDEGICNAVPNIY